ncbi:ArsR/SmtB family transcription factor [Gaopeijia maritima]|uniref:Metalloregulator ArsR/SmtB family transcription factor n=1 Tax=Gaopeijia maritima TaxID=3119007 RepID=A0ABU9E8T5_9BACT
MNHSVAQNDARCEVRGVNEAGVARARSARALDEHIAHLANTFQLLASTTRLRIVEALARQEFCVCDLATLVEVSESAVSHHLRQMRELRIVRYRREGRMAYYRLDDGHVADLFRLGLDHVRE